MHTDIDILVFLKHYNIYNCKLNLFTKLISTLLLPDIAIEESQQKANTFTIKKPCGGLALQALGLEVLVADRTPTQE